MPKAEQKKRLFVVEDEALIAYDVQQRLEAAGYIVTGVAYSAEEALRVLPRAKADLILMDVHLDSDIDGIEVVQKLRPSLQTPVVYLTAFTDQATLTRAKRTEPFGYVVKPLTKASLEITLDLAFHRLALQRRLQNSGQTNHRRSSSPSDEALLNSLETLLCSPKFADLSLCYDPKAHEFFAGCEAGTCLRDLIRTVLLAHAPELSSRVN